MNEKLLNWVLLAVLIIGGQQFVVGSGMGITTGSNMLEGISTVISSLASISWVLLLWVVIYRIFKE